MDCKKKYYELEKQIENINSLLVKNSKFYVLINIFNKILNLDEAFNIYDK